VGRPPVTRQAIARRDNPPATRWDDSRSVDQGDQDTCRVRAGRDGPVSLRDAASFYQGTPKTATDQAQSDGTTRRSGTSAKLFSIVSMTPEGSGPRAATAMLPSSCSRESTPMIVEEISGALRA
jgi:hypothetical protein